MRESLRHAWVRVRSITYLSDVPKEEKIKDRADI